jgi:hypothetical protein
MFAFLSFLPYLPQRSAPDPGQDERNGPRRLQTPIGIR